MKYLILLLLSFLAVPGIFAQTNQSCDFYLPSEVSHLCDSPDWDWEISTSDPDYCKAWTGFIAGKPNSFRMGAPWHTSSTIKLITIGEAQDYSKAQGWRLIKKNFGCGIQDVYFPYFILYNEFTGFTRLFVYMDNTGNFNSAMCEISVSKSLGSNSATALNANANAYMYSPEDYLNEDAETLGDKQTAIVQRGASNGWAVAEFTPLYDPNYSLSEYENSYLQLKIYGITNSTLKLKGTSTAVTEDIRIAGKYASPQLVDGHFKFNLDNKKASKSTKVDAYKAMKGIADAFDKTITLMAKEDTAATSMAKLVKELVTVSKDYKDPVKVTKFLGTSLGVFGKIAAIGEKEKEAKAILDKFKKASGLIGIAGELMGVLIPGASATKPTYTNATITRTNIELSGSITTSINVESINVKLPGTQQTANNITQPFYNCPLGLINIDKKPDVATIQYNRTIGRNRSRRTGADRVYAWSNWNYDKKSFKSYMVDNVPQIVINGSSGASLIEVQAALVAKVPLSSGAFADPKIERGYTNNKFHKNLLTAEKFTQSPMAQELLHDILIPANIEVSDQKYVYVQTPFVDMNCFEGMTLNAISEADVFMRIICAVQTPFSTEPYIFKGDYAINEIGGIPAINANYNSTDYENVLPPYANYSTPFDQYVVDLEIKDKTYPTPWSPTYSCNKCATLTNGPQPMQSGVFHNVSHDITTSGNVDILQGKRYVNGYWPNRTNWVYDVTEPVVFQAGGSITLGPGFEVKGGALFEGKIKGPLNELPECSSSSVDVDVIAGLCGYNNDAWKVNHEYDEELELDFNLYPNPTIGNIFIETEQEGNIHIMNAHGEIIVQRTTDGESEYIDLNAESSGIYMVKVISSSGKEKTKKIILQ